MKDLVKEDILNLSYKDIAYLIMEKSKQGINTLDLFSKIVDLLELPKSYIDSNIGDFYTSLTTDKRFLLVDGLWDLRSRYTSDKVLSKVDEEEDENMLTDDEIEEEDVDNYEENDVMEEVYEEDDDDGLSDLIVLDEEEMESDN